MIKTEELGEAIKTLGEKGERTMMTAREKTEALLTHLCADYPLEYRVLTPDKLARRRHPVIQVFRDQKEIASTTSNWLAQMKWWDIWIEGFRAH